MITQEKPPVAIAVTWSKQMINENGGLRNFIKYFESCFNDDENGVIWFHKCNIKPKHDILWVYLVLYNRVAYRLYYGGAESGPRTVWNVNSEGEEVSKEIDYKRLVLAGPMIKAPHKIPMKGFQGIRYIYDELF